MFALSSAIHGSTFTQLCIFIYVFFYNCFYGVYNLDSEIALISLLVPERGESLYIGLHKALFSTVCLLTRLLSLMNCRVF